MCIFTASYLKGASRRACGGVATLGNLLDIPCGFEPLGPIPAGELAGLTVIEDLLPAHHDGDDGLRVNGLEIT